MVRFTPFVASSLAGLALGTPTARRQAGNNDLLCGGLLQPLAGFLDYQSGNVGGNVQNVLGAAEDILSGTPEDLRTILEGVVGGVVGSLTNGVTNVLYGLSTAVDSVDPECRENAAFCLNKVHAASAACAANEQTQARDACLQAKYTCARNENLTPDQVNRAAPCCAQFAGSPS